MEDIVDMVSHVNVQEFDFNLRRKWIDRIVDELEDNLQLFFCLMSSVQNLPHSQARNESWTEIYELAGLEPFDLIDQLKILHTKLGFCRYEIPDKYEYILKEVQRLRRTLPIKEEALLPFKRMRTQDEKLQWITNILASRTKIQSLRNNIQTTQNAIEETKQDLLTLVDQSSDEIQQIINGSQQILIELKNAGDVKFVDLQNETSRKTLDLGSVPEYHNLVQEHDQKRRKITKLTVQLQLWVKQYDKFVGEPMKELQELEKEVGQFEEWKETVYDPQVERYEALKSSVDLFEFKLTEEQVELFRIAHAARTIQRGWRRVLEKRKRKKKNKRKGKKMGLIGKAKKKKV